MRRAFVIACTFVVAGVLFGPVAPAAASSDVFRGAWESIDPADGSNQFMSIQGSGQAGKHSVSYRDTVASIACGGAPANVQGSGTVEGNTLNWVFTVTCPGAGQGPAVGRVGPGFFTYNAGDDTLIDDAGAVWHRT